MLFDRIFVYLNTTTTIRAGMSSFVLNSSEKACWVAQRKTKSLRNLLFVEEKICRDI